VADVLGAVTDRPYWLTASHHGVPELHRYLRGVIKATPRAVPFSVYASQAPTGSSRRASPSNRPCHRGCGALRDGTGKPAGRVLLVERGREQKKQARESGEQPRVVLTRGDIRQNDANLSAAAREEPEQEYAGTGLGRQELSTALFEYLEIFHNSERQTLRAGDARPQSSNEPRTTPVVRLTRYEKLAVRYETTVLVAAINEWRSP
jgi:hypothetical protein